MKSNGKCRVKQQTYTLKGNLGSLVRVILKVTFAEEEAIPATWNSINDQNSFREQHKTQQNQ